jgi:putative protease
VFNRDFWGGYYLGAPVVELTRNYGSSATRRKVYVGRVTNFFRRPGVAEVLVEASPLAVGEELLVLGTTTGALEFTPDEIFVAERPADTAPQGVRCSLKTPAVVRRGDKIYKIMVNG